MSTIFSKILAGEAPASFVYRDERVAAFMDILKLPRICFSGLAAKLSILFDSALLVPPDLVVVEPAAAA